MARFAYYNEHDTFAAAWLRELIKAGQITDGEVDERDIQQVEPSDLRGFTRCHFFAGIGGWDLALRLAGWPIDRPVWTGSCPCQPFSAAGQNKGGADDRHLWPHWARLIRECRPATLFGEQVDAAVAHGWLDLVFDDLEALDYACGAVDLPAASVGAPHRRQRLWFVADAQHAIGRALGVRREDERDGDDGGRPEAHGQSGACREVRPLAHHHHHHRRESLPSAGLQRPAVHDADGRGAECGMGEPEGEQLNGRWNERRGRRESPNSGELGHSDDQGSQGRGRAELSERPGERAARAAGDVGDVADTQRAELKTRLVEPCGSGAARSGRVTSTGLSGYFWSDATWLPCRDGKWRPTQPEIFPLAYGVRNRVGMLRGAGNAITPQVAAELIKAYLEIG